MPHTHGENNDGKVVRVVKPLKVLPPHALDGEHSHEEKGWPDQNGHQRDGPVVGVRPVDDGLREVAGVGREVHGDGDDVVREALLGVVHAPPHEHVQRHAEQEQVPEYDVDLVGSTMDERKDESRSKD